MDDCRKCQACCKELTITTKHQKADVLAEEFYRGRGEKIYYDADGFLNVVLKDRVCPNLTAFGCKIYDERPLVCKLTTGKDDPELREICSQ